MSGELTITQLVEAGRFDEAIAQYAEGRRVEVDFGLQMDSIVLRLNRAREAIERAFEKDRRDLERRRKALEEAGDRSDDWALLMGPLIGGDPTAAADGPILIRALQANVIRRAVRLQFREVMQDDEDP